MDVARHTHDDDDDGEPQSIGSELRPGRPWSWTTSDTAVDTAPSPRVSLFSPNVPPELPTTTPDVAPRGSTSQMSSIPPPTIPRQQPSLGSVASATIRNARLKMFDAGSPIVQLQRQIPEAQKSLDDPTTTVDSPSRRTTLDPMNQERATMTSLSSLFTNSRAPSYNNGTGPLYLRSSNEAVPLPNHLYSRGLLEGRHSDITVIAFGQRYSLHRLILDRAPFFTTALSEPWIESRNKEVTLHPEEIDHSITQASFELAIRKLYGVDISQELDAEAIGLFATACWLEMQDLIDSAIESILRQMAPDTLAYLIRLVTSNYYGRSGDRILESAKAMLSRNGWEMPLKCWDDMPGDIIRELVGSDGFYVDCEWDRWVLAKRLLDRRLRQAAVEAGLMQRGQKPVPQAPGSLNLMAVRFDGVYRQNAPSASQASTDAQGEWLALYTTPDIERILVLLDEGIHYIHMEYEQLDFIRTARDVFGLPVMPERVISSALWQQLALRQTVLNAEESSQELGLCQTPPEPDSPSAATESNGALVTEAKRNVTDAAEESEIESESWDGNGRARKFWIPSSDCNIVLGNGVDPVVTTSNSFQRHASRLSATIQPEDAQWATDFASTPSNLANPNTRMDRSRPISAGGGNAGQPRPISYTEYPPFRFSAEFSNPRYLKEKKRVYSRTVSYAGSLWNIYIRKVRSAKSVQLGVYLHRAKDREANEPGPSNSLSQQDNGSVDDRRDLRRSAHAVMNDQGADDDTSGSGGDLDSSIPSIASQHPLFSSSSLGRRRSAHVARLSTLASARPNNAFTSPSPTAGNVSESPAFHDDDDDDDLDVPYPNPSLTSRAQRKSRALIPALPPFVDGRPTIKTYFKIYSPSKGGRMLSIYENAPDQFNFSQSWGWKSSTLMLDEISPAGGVDDVSDPLASKKGDGKLRFTVVIGNL